MSIRHLKLLGFGAILAFIALAAGHNGQAVFAQAPCTVIVSAGSPIQAAIDAASVGAVICVEAGSYAENLTIRNKQGLTLQGAGRDDVTLDGSAGISTKKAAIAIEKSEKITIQGFKIVNSRRAIDALNTKQLIVTDNRFEKNLRQSLLLDASEGELRNNLVLNTQKDIDGENGIGIQTFNSVFVLENVTVSGSVAEGISGQGDPSELGSTLTIQKCTLTNNGRAIALASHSKATIRQSTITDNGDLAGIALYESATATIEENTILRNGYAGVFAQDSTDVVVTHNRIAENKSARDKKEGSGIVLRDNSHATIRDNTISGNAQFGVALFHRSRATLVNNTIAENASRGINLTGSAQATIQENTISRNQADGVLLLESAQATIQKNTLVDNNSPGISMRNNSRATIEENLITGNIFAGMHLAEASEAMIIKNEIKSNRADSQAQNGRGINVVANGKVTIRGNTIMGNPSSGVLLFDNVQATVIDNTIASNGVDGIGIGFSGVTNDMVRAEISSNLIQNNRNCGVATDNDSGITITGQSNTISGNRNGQLCGDTSKFPTGFGGGK